MSKHKKLLFKLIVTDDYNLRSTSKTKIEIKKARKHHDEDVDEGDSDRDTIQTRNRTNTGVRMITRLDVMTSPGVMKSLMTEVLPSCNNVNFGDSMLKEFGLLN